MKRLLLISAMLLCSVLPSLAQIATATIFSENGEKFWIVLNGQKQNASAQTNVKLTNLTEAYYKIKIIFEDETIAAMDENIRTTDIDDKPQDVTYEIKKNNKGKYVFRVSNFQPAKGSTEPAPNQVSVPAQTKPQQPAGNSSDGSTTTTVTHQTTTTGTAKSNPNNGSVGMTMSDGMGGNVNFNMNVSGMDMDAGSGSTSTTTTTTTTTRSSSSSSSSASSSQPANTNTTANTAPPSTKCTYPMNSGTFANAKKSIEGQSFEENKMQVAKQALQKNCLSSAQVKEMLGLFSFEKTKVNFAKFAYDRTTDTENYFTINEAFSFSSSVTELNEYINSK
jgi:hypothetical protein